MQNDDFIKMLKENKIKIYDRFYDVIVVLDHISERAEAGEKIGEDLLVIFEVGFSFLHEQLEETKLYYEKYFRRNIASFREYDALVNYLLYLSDLEDTLKDKDLYNDETRGVIRGITEKIENIIREQNRADRKFLMNLISCLKDISPWGH